MPLTYHVVLLAVLCFLNLAACYPSTQTNGGFTCTSACTSAILGGTSCSIAAASTNFLGWATCPNGPQVYGGGYLSCYDYCGYNYVAGTSCGQTCFAVTNRPCGSTAGTCSTNAVCVDNNGNPGNSCTGNSPAATTITCATSTYTQCISTSSSPTTPTAAQSGNSACTSCPAGYVLVGCSATPPGTCISVPQRPSNMPSSSYSNTSPNTVVPARAISKSAVIACSIVIPAFFLAVGAVIRACRRRAAANASNAATREPTIAASATGAIYTPNPIYAQPVQPTRPAHDPYQPGSVSYIVRDPKTGRNMYIQTPL